MIKIKIKNLIKEEKSGGNPWSGTQGKDYVVKHMSLKDILNNYWIAYKDDIEQIHANPDHPDRNWAVYPNAIELKNNILKKGYSHEKPIQVYGNKVVDGAHRINALSLISKDDPSVLDMKLEVHIFNKEQ